MQAPARLAENCCVANYPSVGPDTFEAWRIVEGSAGTRLVHNGHSAVLTLGNEIHQINQEKYTRYLQPACVSGYSSS